VAIVSIPAVIWIRKVLIGAWRRVYVFDCGFIVARGRGPARSQIRLRRGAGRWLVINQETAVRAISGRVPHDKVYD
jgi:hypothetical protein